MPFKPSSSEDFEASSVVNVQGDAYRINSTWEDQAADPETGWDYRNDMHAAFEAYQDRSDIERRSSILAREQAEPGTIFWALQPNPGEVTVVTDGTETDPTP